jgi:hypothetical protein
MKRRSSTTLEGGRGQLGRVLGSRLELSQAATAESLRAATASARRGVLRRTTHGEDPFLAPGSVGSVDALGAAAITEETEQRQDEDHNQDDHKNAEDAPPLVENVLRASAHVKRPRSLYCNRSELTSADRAASARPPPREEAGARACSLYLVSPSCTSPRQAPVSWSRFSISCLNRSRSPCT